MSERDHTQTTQDERVSTARWAGRRGADDRRSPVRPEDDPAPRSPEPDRDAIDKGEEVLERVKPY